MNVDTKAIREAIERGDLTHGMVYQLLDENERLRMENKTIREKHLRQLGLPMRDLCERMLCENEQLKADKAATVEVLERIAYSGQGAPYHILQQAALAALERLKDGERPKGSESTE